MIALLISMKWFCLLPTKITCHGHKKKKCFTLPRHWPWMNSKGKTHQGFFIQEIYRKRTTLPVSPIHRTCQLYYCKWTVFTTSKIFLLCSFMLCISLYKFALKYYLIISIIWDLILHWHSSTIPLHDQFVRWDGNWRSKRRSQIYGS